MSHAIIQIGGHQYRVSPEGTLKVTGDFGAAATIVPAKTLLLENGEDVNIGTPVLENDCKLEVVSVDKGEKIRVATYKAKSRHRRVVGHRQLVTTFKVLDWAQKEPASKIAAPTPKKPAAARRSPKKAVATT